MSMGNNATLFAGKCLASACFGVGNQNSSTLLFFNVGQNSTMGATNVIEYLASYVTSDKMLENLLALLPFPVEEIQGTLESVSSNISVVERCFGEYTPEPSAHSANVTPTVNLVMLRFFSVANKTYVNASEAIIAAEECALKSSESIEPAVIFAFGITAIALIAFVSLAYSRRHKGRAHWEFLGGYGDAVPLEELRDRRDRLGSVVDPNEYEEDVESVVGYTSLNNK